MANALNYLLAFTSAGVISNIDNWDDLVKTMERMLSD